jgi:hypothetical protein
MAARSPSQLLRDSARGGLPYTASRHKLAASIIAHPGSALDPINSFLTQKLFKIDKTNWIVLGFGPKDWPLLDQLASLTKAGVEMNYETLVGKYIISNAERVNRIYAATATISSAILNDDGEAITKATACFDDADRQSLFSFRLFSAQRGHSNELLVNYFKQHMSTDWLRKRFLYPFVYYSISITPDLYIDTFLSYVISTDVKNASERDTIKFLLCDEIGSTPSASFKYYIALLCHPFDACEILLNHLELEFARCGTISRRAETLLNTLAAAIPTARVLSILRLVTKVPVQFVSQPRGETIKRLFALNKAQTDLLRRFVDVSIDDAFDDGSLSRPFAELARMRRSRYPNVDDFTVCTTTAFKWRFTDAGRLLNALLTSIFMVARREHDYEVRMLTRLIGFYGELCPFILSSPSGPWAADRSLLPLERGYSLEDVERLTDEAFKPGNEYKGRLWIKAVHWSLRLYERRGRIAGWLDIVRRDIRISPSFLTGVSWPWIDEIIRVVRLGPFRGRASGVYALLLAQLEERNRDPTIVRTAIEPFAENRSFQEFLLWLLTEYKGESVAFVRFFLTPDNLLMLRLAPNYTAALSLRVSALETCVREFGFGLLLDEKRFRQESMALTTALLLMNISSGQFEIPWDVFRNDINEKELDSYDAYMSLSGTANSLPLLGTSLTSTPYRFRNGKVVNYEFQNNYGPLIVLILSIINGFLEHPSFGLEVLLSTRFRHDTMQREYAGVLVDAKEANISGVPLGAQRLIVDQLAATIVADVGGWLGRRMHTQRPGRPDALFDVAPTQRELDELAAKCQGLRSFDAIILCVSDWLRNRLTLQIVTARKCFESEVNPILSEGISKVRDAIVLGYTFRQSDVLRTAALVESVATGLTDGLGNWFRSGDGRERPPLTFKEVKIATDGVFETQISKGTLRTRLKQCAEMERRITSDKVRLCFDLLSELFANAIKYGCLGKSRVKIWPFNHGESKGFAFSTPIESNDEKCYNVGGELYTSLNDEIFREGNSGLAKIAALSASLVGEKISVRVIQRRRIFHVFVPLWKVTSNVARVSDADA